MIREFAQGVGTLLRGFGMWRTHPRLLALGLIPAVLAFAVLVAVLIPYGLSLGSITRWITPFADGWAAGWRDTMRTALAAVLFLVGLILSALMFTALTLTIGDRFYQRIWRGVERSLGGPEPVGETGIWTTIGEGLRLIGVGVLIALLTLLIGFVPLIGGILAPITGVTLTGRMLARELTARAFDARGLTALARSELLAAGRARVLGFGVATQLCFMVPLGAVITMPAVVAGSTLLARELTDRVAAADGIAQGAEVAPTAGGAHAAETRVEPRAASADESTPPSPSGFPDARG